MKKKYIWISVISGIAALATAAAAVAVFLKAKKAKKDLECAEYDDDNIDFMLDDDSDVDLEDIAEYAVDEESPQLV